MISFDDYKNALGAIGSPGAFLLVVGSYCFLRKNFSKRLIFSSSFRLHIMR